MGTYVKTIPYHDTKVFIKKENFEAIYKKWCDLNKRDDLKRGRSSSGEKWFSWMHPDYPSFCKDMESILDMLGFDYEKDLDGNIIRLSYEDKIGQEFIFFKEIAEYLNEDFSLYWQIDEDIDSYYSWTFSRDKYGPISLIEACCKITLELDLD